MHPRPPWAQEWKPGVSRQNFEAAAGCLRAGLASGDDILRILAMVPSLTLPSRVMQLFRWSEPDLPGNSLPCDFSLWSYDCFAYSLCYGPFQELCQCWPLILERFSSFLTALYLVHLPRRMVRLFRFAAPES